MLKFKMHVNKVTYPSGQTKWVNGYVCHCGKYVERLETSVKNLETAHCGCSYGWDNKLEYGVELKSRWNGVLTRTINKRRPRHKKYDFGPYKDVTMCDEWASDFRVFYKWSIENGFKPHLHIDRINPKLGYSPDNCRWLTQQENNRNGARSKVNARMVREILLLHGVYTNLEISRIYNLDPSTLVNICKGVIWKDVFEKYGTAKNKIRHNPKFLLPIKQELIPETIDFDNKEWIKQAEEGYLSLDKEDVDKYVILDLHLEYTIYAGLSGSVETNEQFFKLFHLAVKGEKIDKLLTKMFGYAEFKKNQIKDFFSKILTFNIRYNFVKRLYTSNKILLNVVKDKKNV